jgi:hypothetical protein
MKTIQIELNKIQPNPFKKFINNGDLDEDTVLKLMEGFKQTTFHENLCAREAENGTVSLIYGHHRLESAKRVYGKNKKISLKVYSEKEFTDEQMLIDMIRENLSQRGDNYRDLSDSVMLAKKWLESGESSVKGFYSTKKGGYHAHKNKEIGARQVADFLSKQGKTLSHTTVSKVIGIEENLTPEVKKIVADKLGRGKVEEGKIGTELAHKISIFPKDEQKKILDIVQKTTEELSEEKTIKLLTKLQSSSEDIKKQVLDDEISLEEVPIENLKEDIQKKIEEDKEKNKGKIVVRHFKQYQREAGNRVGKTNDVIFQTCAFLNGLEKTGVLYELDWNTMLQIIEVGTKSGKNYTQFMEKILEKI